MIVEALYNCYYLFNSYGEAPLKRLLSQLIREDIDVRVALEDAANSPLFLHVL
jgi:hypothetical protein